MDLTQIKNKIIAVDFDNTITNKSKPPITGTINQKMINILKKIKENNKLILWTCREDNELQEAINLCKQNGLEFDKINENIDDTYSRKIKADYYIDDKNICINEILKEEK